ncbi:hypothetical protein BASA81_008431 [Batrachochytrium salamandrivorans]|nr:hypothetical protein BASA81_008431 [Batrachochytrium salamandrivorans]
MFALERGEEAVVWNGHAFRLLVQAKLFGRVICVANSPFEAGENSCIIVRSTGLVFSGKTDWGSKRIVQTQAMVIDLEHGVTCAKQIGSDKLFACGPRLAPCLVGNGAMGVCKLTTELVVDVPLHCEEKGEEGFLIAYESGKLRGLRDGKYTEMEDLQHRIVGLGSGGLAVSTLGTKTLPLPGPVSCACVLASGSIVHSTRLGCVYETNLQAKITRRIPIPQGRVVSLHKLHEQCVLLVLANGLVLPHSISSVAPQSLWGLLDELRLLEQTAESQLDHSELQQRVLACNQSLQLQLLTKQASGLSLLEVRARYQFVLTLPFALTAPNTSFVFQFKRARLRQTCTVAQPSGTKQVWCSFPGPPSLLPIDVSVTVVCFPFAQQLVVGKRFDCLDTGELLSHVGTATAVTARCTFTVFSLPMSHFPQQQTSFRAVELLHQVIPRTGWAFTEQGLFRAGAVLSSSLLEGTVRLWLDFDGGSVGLAGVCPTQLHAAVLREALLRRGEQLGWLSRLTTVQELPLVAQRQVFSALAPHAATPSALQCWALARHIKS